MQLILDTHALIWILLSDRRIETRHRDLLNAATNQVYVSAVSAFELSTKVRIGKLTEAASLIHDFEKICKDFGYIQLPVSHAHGLLSGKLSNEHRDPFDRLLAAQSIVENMPIMTVDVKLRELGAEVVW
jgi:PIN domain nuclease of toxin-antitoxin system